MDTMSIQSPKNSLDDKWNLYYHLPYDTSWDLKSYKIIMQDIDTADKLIGINEVMPEDVVKNCMLFFMRDGVKPTWEDPLNRDGGCFSYKVSNNNLLIFLPNITMELSKKNPSNAPSTK